MFHGRRARGRKTIPQTVHYRDSNSVNTIGADHRRSALETIEGGSRLQIATAPMSSHSSAVKNATQLHHAEARTIQGFLALRNPHSDVAPMVMAQHRTVKYRKVTFPLRNMLPKRRTSWRFRTLKLIRPSGATELCALHQPIAGL